MSIYEVISEYENISPFAQNKGACECPFCKSDSKMMLINYKKGTFHCFECGTDGDEAEFKKRIAATLPVSPEITSKYEKCLAVNKAAGIHYYKNLEKSKKAREYFERRGLSDATIRKFGLGYAIKADYELGMYLKRQGFSMSNMENAGLITIRPYTGQGYDMFRDRVIFPIFDLENHAVGFGGRVLGNEKPKYLNTKETACFNKGSMLYALNYAKDSKHHGLILCEGYMDVIALHQAGFDNAVATLGTAFRSSHADLIKQYTDTVYLTYDSDEAGTKAKLRAIPLLKKAGIDVYVLNVEPYKDPDEFIKAMGARAFQERILNAESSYMFEIRMAARNADGDDDLFKKGVASLLLSSKDDNEILKYKDAYKKFCNDLKVA